MNRQWMTRAATLTAVALCWLAAAPARAAEPAAVAPPVAQDQVDSRFVDVDSDAASADQGQVQKMRLAVRELLAEAAELDKLDAAGRPQPQFRRPHPALAGWGPEMALPALRRMLGSFSGNDYRDTYIRWHLMYAARMIRPQDKQATGPLLVELVRRMPQELQVAQRQEVRYEPPEIYARWAALQASAVVVVGIPPFERQVGPPESLSHMFDADQRRQVMANLAQAQQLRPQFRALVQPGAAAFNQRVRAVNQGIRQYRGELIYAILDTGDPAMLELVTSAIDSQVQKKSGIGFDLLAYMYLAAFDGVLSQYNRQTLDVVARDLERIARGADEYRSYAGRERKFSDYAFHMIYMLKDLGVARHEGEAAEGAM